MTDSDGGTNGIVYGPQNPPPYPDIPRTREDFQQLLENPELPAESQSAPSQEKLNPHLFPVRLP
jgi:hypothetical protein